MFPESAATAARVTNVRYYRPADPGEAAEFDSFIALLPQLRESYPEQYVAVRCGRVIARSADLATALQRAKAEVGTEPFFCGWVEALGGTLIRFGSPTVLPEVDSR